MSSYYNNIDRWLDRLLRNSTRKELTSGAKILSVDDAIYSYGTHFEIARLLRDHKYRPAAFLLNGETISNTTTRHQRAVRDAIAREGLPSVIIPRSALLSAGIDVNTVQIIDVTPDRNETTKHVAYEQPDGTEWVDIGRHGPIELPVEELQAIVDRDNESARRDWLRRKDRHEQNPDVWPTAPDEPPVSTVGDLPSYRRTTHGRIGSEFQLCWTGRKYGFVDVTALEDGRCKYEWTTYRHWLGESLIRAKVTVRRSYPCKACDATGQSTTIPGWKCETCHGEGRRFRKSNRWALFLSGFDHNEYPRNVYFFCELPRGVEPTTVAEAYEALKPDAVRLAEQMGRTVHRQGDIFAIELRDVTKRELRKQGARFENRGRLFGTNHVATETAYLPNGATLVRGTLWHTPAGRTPDHRRVTVGKSWHMAVKNTVPVAR